MLFIKKLEKFDDFRDQKTDPLLAPQVTGKISEAEAELSEATNLRSKENADFTAAEKELVDTMDSLTRARQLFFLRAGEPCGPFSCI